MKKKDNEIRVYLKQEIKLKLDYLASLVGMPTSRLLRLMIEEEAFQVSINSSISLLEKAKKEKQEAEKQMSIYDIK